jgi:hypothetical protein
MKLFTFLTVSPTMNLWFGLHLAPPGNVITSRTFKEYEIICCELHP